jgi:hypothetical protein
MGEFNIEGVVVFVWPVRGAHIWEFVGGNI